MPAQARVTDTIKIDCPYGPKTGIIKTGAERSYIDGLKVARKGDEAVCTTCGGKWKIIEGSDRVYTEGKPNARVGDMCYGECIYDEKCMAYGKIDSGSERTYTD